MAPPWKEGKIRLGVNRIIYRSAQSWEMGDVRQEGTITNKYKEKDYFGREKSFFLFQTELGSLSQKV